MCAVEVREKLICRDCQKEFFGQIKKRIIANFDLEYFDLLL